MNDWCKDQFGWDDQQKKAKPGLLADEANKHGRCFQTTKQWIYTRWAPTIVINGVVGPLIKWPEKWLVTGFLSLPYKSSYGAHYGALLITGCWAHLVSQELHLPKKINRSNYNKGHLRTGVFVSHFARKHVFFQNRGLWACEKHTEIQNKVIASTHFSFCFTKTKKQTIKLWGRWPRWD